MFLKASLPKVVIKLYFFLILYQVTILHRSKLEAFADENFNIAKTMISVCDRVENIVGKGENAGYQHFLLFPQCFQKLSISGLLKLGIVC